MIWKKSAVVVLLAFSFCVSHGQDDAAAVADGIRGSGRMAECSDDDYFLNPRSLISVSFRLVSCGKSPFIIQS